MKECKNMLVNKDIDIILASKSPRRRELLSQINVRYRCIVSEKEEIITKEIPSEVVKELSYQKANDIYDNLLKSNEIKKDTIIIGADTVVSYEDKILGKPKNEEDAFNMIKMLSGKSHNVYTGVCVIFVSGKLKKEINFAECTKVYVSDLSDKDINEYISTGEPMDKAGSYGIQGRFGKYVLKIDGDYNNVVGLPIAALFNKVRDEFGVDLTNRTYENREEVKACIFDLDGTTLDTVESIATTANMVLSEFALEVHPNDSYKEFAGDGQVELVKRALIASGDTELKYFEKAMSRYIELFASKCTYNVVPYDGIRELFEELKKRDIKICIFSNKQHDNVVSILNELFGENYFDYVLGQKDTHKKKPSGEGIDIILENINIDMKNCIYIGDTNTDMMTGKNYGLYTVGVTWGFRKQRELIEANADYIIDNPLDLVKII
ncbi:MAG: septum formation protein Maf [Lachnospiraceae bacterium]|nr:septum formation protein Maf [Lachnospiraceae bacterium]